MSFFIYRDKKKYYLKVLLFTFCKRAVSLVFFNEALRISDDLSKRSSKLQKPQ